MREEVRLLHPPHPDCDLHTLAALDTNDLHARRACVAAEFKRKVKPLTSLTCDPEDAASSEVVDSGSCSGTPTQLEARDQTKAEAEGPNTNRKCYQNKTGN